MSELEEIRVFIQLVESGTATQAAARLGLAVSAISRRMKNLEQRLGVQLMRRTTRRMSLTEPGKTYYRRSRQLVDDLDAMDQEVTQSSQQLKGRLRIATPLSFGVAHLAPAIAAFMHAHPDLDIDLDMSDRRVDLVEEGFDMAIRVGSLEDSTLIARRLAPVSHVVCAAHSFFERYGLPSRPEDLVGLPGLCFGHLKKPDIWSYKLPGNEKEKGSVKVAMKMRSTNGDALREAAIAGLGVLCEPSFIVHGAVERGLLKPVLTDWQWYGMSVYALYPQTRYLSARVRLFIDFLISRFGERPYWESFLRKDE